MKRSIDDLYDDMFYEMTMNGIYDDNDDNLDDYLDDEYFYSKWKDDYYDNLDNINNEYNK